MSEQKFTSHMPTEIIFGANCIAENQIKFAGYKKIFIVTGKSSAKKSGALDDVLEVLKITQAEFMIFDEVTENPLLSTCYKAGKLASEFKADLIIGIGGGSPIDAAKAIAMFGANNHMQPDELFTPPYKNPSLPIFAIPTTAGTGSEANAYSVITLDGQDLKRTFTYAGSYPKTAFLDAKYTSSMPYDVTVSTALDAFCHCIESYLSPKSTAFSRLYAIAGAKEIFPCLESLLSPDSEITAQMREKLMLGSLCGGMAINVTGTGFPHPMGYNLTLINGLPHGKACAVFLNEYLTMHEDYKNTSDSAEYALIIDSLYAEVARAESIKKVVSALAGYTERFDDDTLKFYAEKVKDARNFSNSLRKIDVASGEIFEVYKRVLGK